jgi:hypothetical protein
MYKLHRIITEEKLKRNTERLLKVLFNAMSHKQIMRMLIDYFVARRGTRNSSRPDLELRTLIRKRKKV